LSNEWPKMSSVECKFATYFNLRQKHITTHSLPCPNHKKHEGTHNHDQGGWIYSPNRIEANTLAQILENNLGLPLKPCSACNF